MEHIISENGKKKPNILSGLVVKKSPFFERFFRPSVNLNSKNPSILSDLQFRCAMGTPSGLNRNRCETVRAIFRRRNRRRRLLLSLHLVDTPNQQKDGKGQDDEIDDGIDEDADVDGDSACGFCRRK